jgi:ketopantoate reductase
MSDDLKSRRQLRARIQRRQADIDEFLRHARPRRNVLNVTSIVCSSLAAAFAALPALSGRNGVQKVADELDRTAAEIWQPLCIAAFVAALTAALAANLHRVQDLPAQVSAAEACRAELESLLTMLDFNGLPVPEAAELYQQCVRKIPFVEGTKALGTPTPRRRSLVKG